MIFVKNQLDYSPSYNQIANSYSSANSSYLGIFTIEMLESLNIEKDKTMLDLACGDGFVIENALILNPNMIITGVDISENLLTIAKSKFSINDKIKLIQGDIENSIKDFQDNSFDIITLGFAFSYIQNQNAFLKHIYRILKIGGKFALITSTSNLLPNIQKGAYEIMNSYPFPLRLILKHKYKELLRSIPKDFNDLKIKFIKSGLKWDSGWDGEKSFFFNSGLDTVNWLINFGYFVSSVKFKKLIDIDKKLVDLLERDKEGDKISIEVNICIGIGIK